MRTVWRRRLERSLVAVVSFERGAVFWIPGLLAAAWLTLFAMRVAPSASTLFTHATSLRVVVLPGGTDSAPGQTRTDAALRRRLAQDGELTVVDSVRVARRLATLPAAAATEIGAVLHAVRPLNAHVVVRTSVTARADSDLQARAEVWDGRTELRTHVCIATADLPEPLGRALGDSLREALRRPQTALASRP